MVKKLKGKIRQKKITESVKPLKRSMLGLEAEVFTLDRAGNMINAADSLIKSAKAKYPGMDIVKEAGKNMVELGSFPHKNEGNVIQNLLANFESLLNIAEEQDVSILPLGTYPGGYTPEMRYEGSYGVKEYIFGKTRFIIRGRTCGFHCHYALPWGVFDTGRKEVKNLVKSKNKQVMVDSYNLLIAMDPALTTFMQSSPFYQGKFIGKNSRVIVYRGGDILNYPQGLFSNYQAFGGLQPYKHTGTDLLHLITLKHDQWAKMGKKFGINLKAWGKHGTVLDTSWNPVKINANGTIEQRGMDMNHPLLIASAAMLIKYILKKIQREFVAVQVSDIGIQEPFKVEGNLIYIPPHTHVRNHLQVKSAYEGLDNKDVKSYCKALMKLGKDCIPKERWGLMKPFEKMLQENRTVSDGILQEAKRRGFGLKDTLSKNAAAEIALEHSKRLFKEIIMSRKHIEDL